tara:strand:+ start:797 stop:919 length:123 start_codon:yes stop_codon:yes gene_type:complete
MFPNSKNAMLNMIIEFFIGYNLKNKNIKIKALDCKRLYVS